MLTRLYFVALIGLVGACRQQSGVVVVPRPTADSSSGIGAGIAAVPIGRPRQDVEHFVAAFPAADSDGVCGSLPAAAIPPGEWAATLTFASGSRPARRLTVRYDSTGALTYYSDRRGVISLGRVVRQPDGSMRLVTPTGRRTEIDINVLTGVGLARNTGGDGPEEAYTSTPVRMLDAASLDYPRKTAALVRERCR